MRRSCVCCSDRDTGSLSVGGIVDMKFNEVVKAKKCRIGGFTGRATRVLDRFYGAFFLARSRRCIVTFAQPC